MRRLMLTMLVTMVLTTSCTRDLKFDGFDPATTTLRWIMTYDKSGK